MVVRRLYIRQYIKKLVVFIHPAMTRAGRLLRFYETNFTIA